MHSDRRDSISSTLLESVKARRPEAWRRLVDLYGQVVYRWCRKSGLKAEDAADVVQEVFSAVAMHVADFHRQQARDSFTAWLSTITRNKIRDHFRHITGRPQAPGGTTAQQIMQEIPQPGPAVESEGDSPIFADHRFATVPEKLGQSPALDLIEAEKILSRRAVELVRSEFEPRTWEAWWNTAVEGRPAADVAAEMGMSLAAVYKAKSRVLLRLRQELAGLQGESAN
jgi:RNA polymerase sigma-70 factor (ECF subfamily)